MGEKQEKEITKGEKKLQTKESYHNMHLNPRHAKARGLYKTFKKKLRLRIQIIVFYGTDEAMGRSLV